MDLGGDVTIPSKATKFSADIRQGILEGYGMYRFQTDRGPVDVYGGIRWTPQIAEKWSLILKGDIGGFGVASDFTWNIQGGVSWDAKEWMSLIVEYRALSVDYSTGTQGTTDRFEYDTITHGPMFGIAFKL